MFAPIAKRTALTSNQPRCRRRARSGSALQATFQFRHAPALNQRQKIQQVDKGHQGMEVPSHRCGNATIKAGPASNAISEAERDERHCKHGESGE